MEPLVYPPGKVKDLIVGVNDLKTRSLEIANELVGDPSQVLAGSTKDVEWECSLCNNRWFAQPRSRTRMLNATGGCPDCARKEAIVTRGFKKMLKDVYPPLVSELTDQSDADHLTYSSHNVVYWTCPIGHNYQMSVNKRINGRKCPYCNFHEPLQGFNNLGAVRPDLIKEVIDESKLELLANSQEVIDWQHTGDDGVTHLWKSKIIYRAYQNSNCHICSGFAVQIGVNDFKTFLDKSKLEWCDNNDVDPSEITTGSSKKVTLICKKHKDHNTMTDHVKNFSSGSRICQDCKPTGDWFRSKGEQEVVDFITDEYPDLLIETNVRRFKKHGISELDAFVENKVAVDYNGDYWHQEGVFKPIGFHKKKRAAVKSMGFPYIEVKECDWKNTPDTVRLNITEVFKTHFGLESKWRNESLSKGAVKGVVCDCDSVNGSVHENALSDFVESLGVDVVRNDTVTFGDSVVSMTFPDLKVAVDFICLKNDSEKFVGRLGHFQKFENAKNAGYRLLQIWEDDWVARRSIVESHIKSVLGVSDSKRVFARKCAPVTVDSIVAKSFLNNNHVQGFVGASHYVGLEHNGEIVALAAFLKSGNDFTLVRYATSCSVIGGHSKIVKYFEKTFDYDQLVTFADLTFSDGGLYRSTGWDEDKVLNPDYSYVVNNERAHKFGYRKARFESDPLLKFDSSLTERELAELNGLVRIWDSGKVRFIKPNFEHVL